MDTTLLDAAHPPADDRLNEDIDVFELLAEIGDGPPVEASRRSPDCPRGEESLTL